jgi:ATP-dependent Lhr-like helicase
MEDWPVNDLYQLVRRAYPYRDLTPAAFDAVLEMVSGRYRFSDRSPHAPREDSPLRPAQQLSALQPRISWDRTHQKLRALPGSQRLAVVHGGTIPDTGQYAVYTGRGLRIGEVDEEFVYERRIGDTFLLGTNAWRIDRIETDRVLVHAAEGTPAMVPFWRGEQTGRTYDLGVAQGKFLRELAHRIDGADCLDWLERDYFLDAAAAANLRDFVKRQQSRTQCVPTDRLLLIEASRDPLGDWQVVLLCPLGRAINLSLRLALEHRLHVRLGYRPQCLHHDDGLLIRLTESDEPVLDLFEGITPENVRDMILEELADSALFALRFRQNAARALMMPRGAAGKRAPLWLQRLRGRDLLQVARQHPDFPIVAETFRECLHDHLDLPQVQQLLGDIGTGAIDVQKRRLELPSPFAAGLLFSFTMAFMYQYDGVEAGGDRSPQALDQALLDQLIGHEGKPLPLDPRAIQQVDRRLRGVGQPPRTKAETAEWLRSLGDVAPSELEGPILGFLRELEQEKTAARVKLPGVPEPERWILAEEVGHYRSAFASEASDAEASRDAAKAILQRFLDTHALVGLDDVLQRYPFERGWAQSQLETWTRQGRLVRVEAAEAEPLQWSAPPNFDQMQRGTLSILRREVMTCPTLQFADFVLRWQHVHPDSHAALPEVLHRLQATSLPVDLWERAILPLRCSNYQPRGLDELIAAGQWTWYGRRETEDGTTTAAFVEREALPHRPPPNLDGAELDQTAISVLDILRARGASFSAEIASQAKLTVSRARSSLWKLLRLGLVTNDQYDLLRRGESPPDDDVPQMRSRGELRAFLRNSGRRRENGAPEGRWSLLAWGQPDPESAALFQARLLLDRYGFATRELALLSGTPTQWRVLYEILSRLELAGDVRRGYFVEGLSGAQFALPEAAKQLHEIALPSQAQAPVILVHSLDPANLYGSAAPFELLIPADEPRPFQRRPGNWLVMKAGRPLLLIEQHGKRLTAMPHASAAEMANAVGRLPRMLKLTSTGEVRHRLSVETWNEQPVTMTMGRDLLEGVGFVRDYQAMTLYAVWQQ